MALRIFDTDPDAAPKSRYIPEFDFQFRSGMRRNGQMRQLAKWRVMAADPKIADAIQQLMGGSAPAETEPDKPFNLEVLTDSDSVEIVIDGPDVIKEQLILWGPAGAGPIHVCDGEFFLDPAEDRGTPCGCPRTLKERKAASRKKRGPAPYIVIPFRFAEDYDLGCGKYIATAWTFAETVHLVKNDLAQVGAPALCRLRIEKVEFENRDGELVSYRKPAIDVIGSYNDAIAAPRD